MGSLTISKSKKKWRNRETETVEKEVRSEQRVKRGWIPVAFEQLMHDGKACCNGLSLLKAREYDHERDDRRRELEKGDGEFRIETLSGRER